MDFKEIGQYCVDFIWLRNKTSFGLLDDHSGSMKC
jgi:hypothetical protein